jgi:hypothetical protein
MFPRCRRPFMINLERGEVPIRLPQRQAQQNPEYPVDVPISTTFFAAADSVSNRSAFPSCTGTLR